MDVLIEIERLVGESVSSDAITKVVANPLTIRIEIINKI